MEVSDIIIVCDLHIRTKVSEINLGLYARSHSSDIQRPHIIKNVRAFARIFAISDIFGCSLCVPQKSWHNESLHQNRSENKDMKF